ncbi:MAG: DUF262 domain-containing protein [Desulfobacteraceae bacterium]|nr:DUF262 domain-containing protein [Desulfobacteraceae bacterium]
MKGSSDLYKEIPVEDENTGNPLMEEPFNPSEINIDIKSPTISIIIDRLSQNPPEIDLYSDFQRSDDLWSIEKQSQFIESILIKFPLPAFYFDGTNDEKWLVVDGLQRLSSLRNYIIDKTLTLTGLEFLKDLEGTGFDKLPRKLKRIIDQTQIIAYIINPGTPLNVKYNIFKRINTGGLILEPQEIRHALNQGIPAQFVAELARLKEFRTATENKISPKRMLDREFVTRYVSFYITETSMYLPDLDSFLNLSMSRLAEISDESRVEIRENFIKAMVAAHKIFGKWAFRKADEYPKRRKPINKALFEIWAVTLAGLTDEQIKTLIKRKKDVIQKFAHACKQDDVFWNAISSGTGEKNRIVYRFLKVNQIVQEILND